MSKLQEAIEKKQQQSLLEETIGNTKGFLDKILTHFIKGEYEKLETDIEQAGCGMYVISAITGLDFDKIMEKYIVEEEYENEANITDGKEETNNADVLDGEQSKIVVLGKDTTVLSSVKFPSDTKAAEACGKSQSYFSRVRRKNNFTREETVEYFTTKKNKKTESKNKVGVEGNSFATDKEASEACNVSQSYFCKTKKKHNYTREQTVEYFRKRVNEKSTTGKKKTSAKEKKEAEEERLFYEKVARVHAKLFTEFSIKALIEGPCVVKGFKFPTIELACEKYKQDVSLVKQRVQNDWSVSDAILIKKGGHRPKHKKRRNKNDTKSVSVEGVWFRDLYEASFAYNIAYSTVIARVFTQNWTNTDALKTPLTYHKTHIHASTAVGI